MTAGPHYSRTLKCVITTINACLHDHHGNIHMENLENVVKFFRERRIDYLIISETHLEEINALAVLQIFKRLCGHDIRIFQSPRTPEQCSGVMVIVSGRVGAHIRGTEIVGARAIMLEIQGTLTKDVEIINPKIFGLYLPNRRRQRRSCLRDILPYIHNSAHCMSY